MPEKKPTRTADLDYFYGQSSELFSFYRIPKLLFQDSRFQPLSTDAKTLYGILLDRMSLSARNGWLDKAGRVFIIYTVQEVQDSLGCADKKATKLLRELEEYGLIERKRRGLGKPDLIYVKNFSSESSKTPYLNRDNDDSGTVQNTLQDPVKLRCNKTKENDTEMSETDPFYSEESDGMSKRTQLEEYFSQSLEVDLLLRLCPDDEDTIYQIVDFLVDTCATKRKTLRIAGDDKPAEVVRSRFMKLNADHMPYLPEDAQRQLQTILNNASNITDDQKHFLQAIKNDVDCLYQKLCDLKSIGFRNLKDVAQIESTLRNKKIDLPNYANLNSDLMRSKTNVLNTTIDGVLNRIIQLRIKISRQNALIRNIISRNQKEINDFLRYAGYHYTVSIEESEGKNYRLLLHYEDHREAINAVQAHLSYGERNALALLLFMYSIKRETPDLVILDDPISSFDGNKKFAIVNMLFKEPGYLRGKTVLLLTHEFGTVVDMVHTMKRNFGAVSTAAFLSTRNGVLQEQQIHADDIKAYPAIAEKNIAESTDPLNKLIYLRRLMEFENNKNDAWQLLSNVFHVGDGTREAPMKCIGNGIEIPMTPDEVQKGTEDIKKYILDFDYQMAYQRMEDQNLLISLYDSTEANYEKLQIYRLIFIGRPMNVVVQKFVNETYHVENDYMFQLDPRIYDTVPQYIVDVCNQAINELRTVQPA